jgi:hypothetical protein
VLPLLCTPLISPPSPLPPLLPLPQVLSLLLLLAQLVRLPLLLVADMLSFSRMLEALRSLCSTWFCGQQQQARQTGVTAQRVRGETTA